ncbi:MAG: hypothetical protein Q4C30_08905 [Bacteroidia bacterium]|nr:hypothetical protein [Bacteroidia bacterium]
MKTFNTIKVAALAVLGFASVSAYAKSDAKVYVNNFHKNNMAVVSVNSNNDNNSITYMEVTNEAGNTVYVSKRVAKVKAAQYLLDIAKLEDGAYTVSFSFRKGQVATKTFIVADGKVVR